jgi:hypothetical protein
MYVSIKGKRSKAKKKILVKKKKGIKVVSLIPFVKDRCYEHIQ